MAAYGASSMGYLLAFVSCHSCGSWNQSNKLLLCGFSPQRVLCFQENINETLASPYSGAPSSIPPSFFWINSMHQYTSPSFSPPLEVVLDNSTLESTQPEILAFICISLSLSREHSCPGCGHGDCQTPGYFVTLVTASLCFCSLTVFVF